MGNRVDETIPIIDLSALQGNYDEIAEKDFKTVAQAFGTAMSSVGFVYIKNHGVEMNKISDIATRSKDFFNLPREVKNKYTKPNAVECFQGYAGPGMHKENSTNSMEYREVYDIWGFEQFSESNFPEEVPNWKPCFDEVRPQMYTLSKKLLRCLGYWLQLEDPLALLKLHSFMDDETRIRTQTQSRVTHYFPMEPKDPSIPPGATRCGEHTDWGSITLLFQDNVGGLEVQRRDGSWMEATPIPDTVLVNAGQFLERWSAGGIKATPHRVRILDEERTRSSARQSFVFFVNPDGDTVIKPLVPKDLGREKYFAMEPIVAYEDYQRQIREATGNY